MSKEAPTKIIEWSPNDAIAYDSITGQFTRAANLVDLAQISGSGPVVAAVSRRSTFVKAVRVPNAGAAEIDLILRTQMATMFPVPLHELAYSFRLVEDVNEEGRLAIVAAMRESDLLTLLADAKSAGYRVLRVVPSAMGSVALAESMNVPNVAVVQETAEGLAIDLIAGGTLRYSRVAPMPANPDLIESEVTRSFQAVGLPCSPTLAAGGFPFAEAELKSQTPTLKALIEYPLDKLGISLETNAARERRENARQANRVRLAALLCAAAGLMALLVFLERADKAEEVRIANAKWQLNLTKLRNESKKLEADVSKVRDTAASLKRAFQPAQTASDVLTVVANKAPRDLWLTGITFERGKLMYIRGTAATSAAVTEYLQQLSALDRLRDTKLVFANNGEIEKTPIVQFAIQAFPVGNLPLVETKKKGAKK
jgi:hypothetical protein